MKFTDMRIMAINGPDFFGLSVVLVEYYMFKLLRMVSLSLQKSWL